MNKFLLLIALFLFSIQNSSATLLQDEFVEQLTCDKEIETYSNYNFESTTRIPIKIKILEPIKSEKNYYEGETIEFKIARESYQEKKLILERGKIIKAKASTIISPGMNGIPASIIFTDFEIDGIKKSQLTPSLEISGRDRSLMVFPLKWALTILPPLGSFTNLIKGGHAKLNDEKIITIYYYPNWE